jgi:hypothetical protein
MYLFATYAVTVKKNLWDVFSPTSVTINACSGTSLHQLIYQLATNVPSATGTITVTAPTGTLSPHYNIDGSFNLYQHYWNIFTNVNSAQRIRLRLKIARDVSLLNRCNY